MPNKIRRSSLALVAFVTTYLLTCTVVHAQLSGGTDVNLSKKTGYQAECAIAKNPSNKLQLFALCNNSGPGLLAARSTNGGATWTFPDAADKTIADGDAGQGPAACCDPNLAWDTFGNLFITYLDTTGANVVTILSTDGGLTFTNLASFPGSVDQPTVVASNTSAPGAPVAVWIVWNDGSMKAKGAAVTGLGIANIGAFGATQTIPGTNNCSFGDVVIAPTGVVVQTCEVLAGGFGTAAGQAPTTILVNIDADGLGAGNFGPAIVATPTNVGAFDSIPPQATRTVDAEPGLAYDRNQLGDPSLPGGVPSPHFGRLYLVYTDEVGDETDNTDIMLRFSDNDGTTWSAPIRVNDDATTRSQFFPKIASNPLSGNIAVCWHDARNSATNTAMQEFCAIANRDLFPAFIGANVQISDGASTSSANPNQFSDYAGLTYFQGLAHPVWGDTSNSGGLNPDGTAEFDAYTDSVTGGPAANEGDPHLVTVDGTPYDFQSAGEFVALRDSDGLEIQTRQTPVSTTSTLGPNGHTGLTTCVSLNTAVAARVGTHRVSYQPNLNGVPDPSGLQLRVDGVLTTLGASGLNLGSGGRVAKAGDGIEIDFPNGTVLVVTPLFWSSYSVWYLNVNVYHTSAVLGVMGAITSGTWLPRLPDHSSLGPRPVALHDRYVDLYQKFADAWRVTQATSLFDYAPGTSTATFTLSIWPMENQQCVIPQTPPVRPLDPQRALALCRGVAGKQRQANCVFDVTVTGEPGFAKLYLNTERVQAGLTSIVVSADKDRSRNGEVVTFAASVMRAVSKGRGAPTGTVQFILDGERAGVPVRLVNGRATWKTSTLKAGKHQVAARYTPIKTSVFLASSSPDTLHTVGEGDQPR
jgi:hypothetical protein